MADNKKLIPKQKNEVEKFSEENSNKQKEWYSNWKKKWDKWVQERKDALKSVPEETKKKSISEALQSTDRKHLSIAQLGVREKHKFGGNL